LTVSFVQNPTRQWLRGRVVTSTTSTSSSSSNKSKSSKLTSNILSSMQMLINGTCLDRSVASLDRFQWLNDDENDQKQQQHHRRAMLSLEFVAEVQVDRPGYVQVLSASHAGSTGCFLRRLHSSDADHRYERHDPTRIFSSNTHSNNNVNAFFKWQLLKDGSTLRTKMNRLVLELAQKQQQADRIWITGFALGRRCGLVQSIEVDNGSVMRLNDRSSSSLLWPNEVTPVPTQFHHHEDDDEAFQDALLVSDGFLVPGKDRGGLYIVKHPGNPQTEWTVRLTSNSGTEKDRWFYHRATWLDLTGGDGRQSILTARCKVSPISTSATSSTSTNEKRHGNSASNDNTDFIVTRTTPTTVSGIRKQGQLIWLECPLPSSIDPATGTPLEKDGTVFDPFSARHLPWKEHILVEGPDVVFCVAQLDDDDDGSDDYTTIQVLSSQFFQKRVCLHSIQIPKSHHAQADSTTTRRRKPRVIFERIIDDQCGAAFGCILANLDGDKKSDNNHFVVDSGSTVPTLVKGDSFSHLLVTSHERSFSESINDDSILSVLDNVTSSTLTPSSATTTNGGSLFAYRIPEGKGAWKTQPWTRTTVATGFKVKGGLGNMINPGAPGFVYTFYAKKQDKNSRKSYKRPMIAVAGDCAESAYLFRPSGEVQEGTAIASGVVHTSNDDPSTRYKLMFEIQCDATVGSIGVGYDDFVSAANQGSGYAKLYIPCFEKDKILVFALGSGDGDVYDESYDDDELEVNG
jgi:hypothetical protein